MALDGLTLALPNEEENRSHFGPPDSSRGSAGFPKLDLTVLMEISTRAPIAWCGGAAARVGAGAMEQAERLVAHLEPGMLLLADRCYCGLSLWSRAVASCAELLKRVKSNMLSPALERLPDAGLGAASAPVAGRTDGGAAKSTQYACSTTALPASRSASLWPRLCFDPSEASAAELAALRHKRWEFETAYDEVKTHMLGSGALLRS